MNKRIFGVISVITMLLALVIILSPVNSITAKASSPSSVGELQLFKNVYGTGSFYDVWRNPAYPEAGISQKFDNFSRKIYSGLVYGYELEEGEYVKFEYEECLSTANGAVCDDLFSNSTKYYQIKLGLYNGNGTRKADIANYAIFYGPSTEDGVMFCELDDYGGLLLTSDEYENSDAIYYVPTIGKITLMSELAEYKAIAFGMSKDEPSDGYKPDTTIAANFETTRSNEIINVTPSVENNDFGITLDSANLKDAILVSNQETKMGFWVWAEAKDVSETVNPADAKIITDNVKNATVGAYLDINVFRQVAGWNKTRLPQTTVPLKFSITVPESIAAADREYAIVRVHDGAYAQITGFQKIQEGNTIEFSSDLFSTYAIIYKSAVPQSPKTGEGLSWLYIALVCSLAAAGLFAAYRKKI